jgi:Leucine-rich repeat (LRR) protein
LKTICQIKNIGSLYLDDCKNLTDEGFREIANLENLEALWLDDANITDASVQLLKDLPLEDLRLRKTSITDASIRLLKDCPLGRLTLSYTQVDGSCFDTDDGWEKLWLLNLEGCQIKDEIFDYLPNLKRLTSLNFSIGDDIRLPPNFENLLKCEHLETIRIYGKNLETFSYGRKPMQTGIQEKWDNARKLLLDAGWSEGVLDKFKDARIDVQIWKR